MTHIRMATVNDAPGVQAIYAPIVRDTVISFEAEPPSVTEFERRIANVLKHWPWLVCETEGIIVGYVYASEHRARAAYRWSSDVTVYIHPNYRRGGVGRALYSALFAMVELQGFYNAFAGVTLPNAGSVGLHESMGFRPIGVYKSVGFKFGEWHDVGWWQLELQESRGTPTETVPIGALSPTTIESICETARRQLRV